MIRWCKGMAGLSSCILFPLSVVCKGCQIHLPSSNNLMLAKMSENLYQLCGETAKANWMHYSRWKWMICFMLHSHNTMEEDTCLLLGSYIAMVLAWMYGEEKIFNLCQPRIECKPYLTDWYVLTQTMTKT